VKAITVIQPWADAILFLGKNIENRTQPTKLRGFLVIHSSQKWSKEGEVWIRQNFKGFAGIEEEDRFIEQAAQRRGMFLGSCELADCVNFFKMKDRPFSDRMWASGPWCYVLKNPKACKPIPALGRLGIWETPPSLFKAELEKTL
jgi:hypothetical protein